MSLSHLSLLGSSSTTVQPCVLSGQPVASLYPSSLEAGNVSILQYTPVTSGSGSSTATPTLFIGGIYRLTGGSTATVTTPTAADIKAYLILNGVTPSIGDGFRFRIVNSNSGNATFAAGTGVTLVLSSATLATNTSNTYDCVFTAVDTPTISIYG